MHDRAPQSDYSDYSNGQLDDDFVDYDSDGDETLVVSRSPPPEKALTQRRRSMGWMTVTMASWRSQR